MINNTNILFSDEVSTTISTIYDAGEEQFLRFWNERLIQVKVPIDSPIKSNKFKLPDKSLTTSAQKDPTLNQSMITKLRSAYSYRKSLLIDLFASEIFGVAQSIAEDSRKLYHGTKSDILKRFGISGKSMNDHNESSIIIELSPVIKAKSSSSCTTFNDFAVIIYNHVMYYSSGYKRCDIIADRYFSFSLKDGTRNQRGSVGSTMNFTGDTRFPLNFGNIFLKNSQNKDQLNLFLAKEFMRLHESNPQELVLTFKETVLSNRECNVNDFLINNCKAEEADTKVVRHGISQTKQGFKHIVIRTVDTDVLILLISYCHLFKDGEILSLSVQFGTGYDIRLYDILELHEEIGDTKSLGLPFFHAFTGCDTTSSFFQHGKCKFRDAWMASDPPITNTFIELSNMPIAINADHQHILELYLMAVYLPKSYKSFSDINDARIKSFFHSTDPKLRSTIISRKGLYEHIKRSALQAGWLWKECEKEVEPQDPALWGWVMSQDRYYPLWQDSFVELQSSIMICSCKEGKCLNCKCAKNKIKCLEYCCCQRRCFNS